MAMLLTACGGSTQDQVIADGDRNGGTISIKDSSVDATNSAPNATALAQRDAKPDVAAADPQPDNHADDDADDGADPVAKALSNITALPASKVATTPPTTNNAAGTTATTGTRPTVPAASTTPATGSSASTRTAPTTGTAPVAGAKPTEPAKPATPATGAAPANGTSSTPGTAPVAGAKPAEPARPAAPATGTSPTTGTTATTAAKPTTTAGSTPNNLSKPPVTAPTSTTTGEHRFVVMFKQHVTNSQTRSNEISTKHGGKLRHAYGNAVRGFAITVSDTGVDAFLKSMDLNPDIAIVEEDIPIRASQTTGNTQTNATWGLDRVDQRDLPLNGGYGFASNAATVRAYVVDTGILGSHVDFNGRVGAGFSAINDGYGTGDCNGHGTHVAGTIGGATWGIAKAVNLVPVRVLDCTGSGSLSGVIAGLDWIATNGIKPAVVNMSLGGAVSSALDTAVSNVINAGYSVVVAAGNENVDACYASPARTPAAITVGASTNVDARATFSNWGACIDVFAPGAAIASTWHSSTVATATLNGTSMASPHVAGQAALILAANPAATPAQVAETIRAAATPNKLATAGTGSPNLLMFTGATSTITPPPPTTTTRSVLVSALVGKGTLSRKGWSAAVSVTVKDASGAVVRGAVVKGDFTLGGLGLSCTTNTSGVCALKSGNLSTSTTSTSFTVKAITGTSLTYDASRNVLSTLVVNRP